MMVFAMSQMIHHQISDLAGILKKRHSPSLYLVVDQTAFQQTGLDQILEPLFQNYPTFRFHQFTPNPDLAELETAVASYRQTMPDTIIAIGGGTALDLGKLVSLFGQQSEPCRELVLHPPSSMNDPANLIAIPTTAGTGSEATHFAVIYIDTMKYSVADPRMLPSHVILDPKLTRTMPATLTADTGLDAFCQAVESMWSIQSTEASRQYAQQAITLAWKHLPPAVLDPTSQARAGMCQAAHLSGKAINISRTTAPHALSYAFTSLYAIPHGRAVALTLPLFFRAACHMTAETCLDPRGVRHVASILSQITNLLGCDTPDQVPETLERFIESLGCPTSLQQIGITNDQQLEQVITRINFERVANYPVKLDQRELKELFMS